MRADLALFFSTLMVIAVVSLLVRNGKNTSSIIRETGNALSATYGTLITGNPQFYERARGYGT